MAVFDLVAHLEDQRAFSLATFGPGGAERAAGILDHIRKELGEIEAEPADLLEWIDVVILAFDGAWRTGATPEQIVAALAAKHAKNKARTWPDWRTATPGKAIEHVREAIDPDRYRFTVNVPPGTPIGHVRDENPVTELVRHPVTELVRPRGGGEGL